MSTKKGLRVVLAGAAAVALTITCAQSGTGQAQPGVDRVAYLDASAPVDRRVDDLMRRMTLEEKIGQLTQIRVGKLRGDCQWTPGPLRTDCMRAVLVDAKVGSILSGGGDFPVPENSPRAWAEMTNTVQRFALDNSRLRIPVLYGADGVHGHSNVLTATMFPHQIGLAATWDPATVQQGGRITGNAMRATGVFWNFAPVSDLARDTRWGRYYETFGEDPVLAGTMAAAAVRGMQTNDSSVPAARLTATAKHFAGYSQPFNGHDRAPAFIPIRQLQDTVLPPFQAQVDAGVGTVMANSGSVNGIPVHASKYLLTEQLRDRMGFGGVVITDWEDIRSLVTRHHVAPDYPSAIAMAVNAGVDIAMEPSEAGEYTAGLLQVVRDGRVGMRRIDDAVRHVLTLKFSLGLFERPFVDPAMADSFVTGVGRDVARRLATESMVLLRNEGNALPLATSVSKLVVAGDTADSVPRQLGGWTIGWQGVPDGGPVPDAVTVLEGIREAVPAANVVHATTTEQAVAEAGGADAVIVVLGERPGAEGLADTENPALSAEQQALVDAVQASGRPVIVVMLTGRPRVLGAVADASALLAGWLPGTEGGHAVADVLFGVANPSGRLPVSWPKTVGDQPMSYDQLPSTNGGDSSGYDPAFPFAHGLSYTSFAVSGVSADAGRDEVTVRFTVRNSGQRAGTAVVPVFVRQPVSPVQVPERRLAGFARVDLAPGAQQEVTVRFPVRQLALTVGDVDGAGRREVLRGGYEAEVQGQRAGFTVR